jgi:tRNA dimethylallyltransferase
MVATKQLIVIVGETASGKSSLAIKIAEQFNGEIICADATTVRKRADIGTAKPSPEDQKLVPHHLLDLVEPNQKFNVSDFKQLAEAAINDIKMRGKLPIMVGGSGLYVDSVLYDYSFSVTDSKYSREQLNSLSLQELQQITKGIKPNELSVDIKNKHRLIRYIETNGKLTKSGIRPTMRGDAVVIGINIDRELLRTRLVERINMQLNSGLQAEVESIIMDYGIDSEVMKYIGYREWKGHLDGSITSAAIRDNIVQSSLALAKKQRTWFKRNKSIHWFNYPVNYNLIVDLITSQ